jgi:pyruvate dehydrogenase E1 component alpha subunit
MKIKKLDIPDEKLLKMYEDMLLIRYSEEKCIDCHPEQLMKSPHHYYIGQEAVAVGVCAALTNDDYVFSTHRSHGHYLAKGGDLNAFMAEMYLRVDGCSRGKGGSMHLIDTSVGHMGSSAIVSGSIPIAAGAAWAFQLQNKKNVAVSFFGDGAADEGVLYESLNFSALKKSPVLYVCENNQFASFSKVSARQAVQDIAKRAEAFGVTGKRINGMDVLEVYAAAVEAVKRARDGKGPTLFEAITYRFKAHCGIDDDIDPKMRTIEELNEWKKQDPITQFRNLLMEKKILTEKKDAEMKQQLHERIEKAVVFGRNSPLPKEDELLKDVFQ